MPVAPTTVSERLEEPVGVYRDQDVLVVERTARLPGLCVQCGNPADPRRIRQGFNWRHPETYLLLFYSWLGILLLMTVVRERLILELPLCRRHRRYYQLVRRSAYLLLLGALPAYLGWGVITDAKDLSGALGLFFAMLTLGIVLRFFYGTGLRAAFISDSYGCLIGAGDSFLAHLPPRPPRISSNQ